MTLRTTKTSFNIRDALNSLKKKTGIAGEQVMRAQTNAEVYTAINPVMFRNKVVNGNFDVWQRGTSLSATNAGGLRLADQWVMSTGNSGGTATFSRQTATASDVPIFGTSRYYYRHNQTVPNGSRGRLQQNIEGVGTLAGGHVTLSFYVKANKKIPTAPLVFDAYFTQNFGTGGSPSAFVSTSPVNFSEDISTNWKRVSATVFLPSIAGKTLGTDNNDCLFFEISMPPNDTYTIDFAQIQLEAGTSPTPFEVRHLQTELAICQRYCVVDSSDANYQVFGIGNASSSTNASVTRFLPVTMRAKPAVTVSNVAGFIADAGANAPQTTGVSGAIFQTNHVRLAITTASGLTSGQSVQLVNDSSGTSRSIIYSAEI